MTGIYCSITRIVIVAFDRSLCIANAFGVKPVNQFSSSESIANQSTVRITYDGNSIAYQDDELDPCERIHT